MATDRWERFRRLIGGRLTLVGLVSEIMAAILMMAGLAVIILALTPDDLLPLLLLTAMGILIFWLLRLFAARIWQILLPSLLLFAGPVLAGWLPVWPRMIFAAAMLLLALRAITRRLRPEPSVEHAPPFSGTIAALGWLLVVNVAAAWQNQAGMVTASFYLGNVYLLLSVFRRHQIALNTRLLRFVPMESQPTGRIRRFNYYLLAVFVLALTLVFLAAPVLHLDAAIPWLASVLFSGLKALIRWLQSMTRGNDDPGPTDETTETTPEPTETGGMLPEPGETAAWLVILQQIFYYVILIGAFVVLLALLAAVAYSIYRKFYENRPAGQDVREVLLPKFAGDIRASLQRSRQNWTRQFGRSPEQRIRRSYYRLVDELIRQGLVLLPGMTPQDIIEMTDESKRTVLGELTLIYEKARYGPDLCNSIDARRMHDLCRQYRLKQEK